jgi:hypothetical protein
MKKSELNKTFKSPGPMSLLLINIIFMNGLKFLTDLDQNMSQFLTFFCVLLHCNTCKLADAK